MKKKYTEGMIINHENGMCEENCILCREEWEQSDHADPTNAIEEDNPFLEESTYFNFDD